MPKVGFFWFLLYVGLITTAVYNMTWNLAMKQGFSQGFNAGLEWQPIVANIDVEKKPKGIK